MARAGAGVFHEERPQPEQCAARSGEQREDKALDQELPDPAFAARTRELADATGAALILDDVRAGFRLDLGGNRFNVNHRFGLTDSVIAFNRFIAPGLHYRSCLTCSPDIFYVAPERRTSIAGIRMFRFVEKELKRRGVKRWAVGSKVQHDASALFKFLDFKPVETTYEKWLGD